MINLYLFSFFRCPPHRRFLLSFPLPQEQASVYFFFLFNRRWQLTTKKQSLMQMSIVLVSYSIQDLQWLRTKQEYSARAQKTLWRGILRILGCMMPSDNEWSGCRRGRLWSTKRLLGSGRWTSLPLSAIETAVGVKKKYACPPPNVGLCAETGHRRRHRKT